MVLTVRNDFARYRIECPDNAEVKNHDDTDFLIVCHDAEPYWLFDDILLEAARCGEFGLRLLSLEPLN